MTDIAPGSPAAPLIGDALDLLGGALVAATPSSSATGRSYLDCVFLETGAPGRRYADRLVLAPGLDPGHQEFETRLRELRAGGAAGVVIKRPESDIPPLAPELADALLLLEHDADWADTARSLRVLGAGDSRLAASGIRQGDLFALANTLAALAGGAVSLVDTAGRVVGYSTHVDQPIDALRRSTTLALHEGHHPRSDSQFRQLAASPSALFFDDSGSQYGRVALPVRAAGELLGTVWIIQVDPNGAEETRRFLDSVEPLVSHHMLRARETAHADERRSTDLVRALFEDAKSRPAAAAQLGLDPGSAHTVVCFRLLDIGGSNPVLGAQQLLHQAATTARGQFAWSHCAMLDGVVVALLGSGDASLIRLFADRITRISRGGALAGIGRVAHTQTLIPRSYREAASISRLLAAQPGPADGDAERVVAEFSEVHAELGLARVRELLQDSELLEGDDAERILAHDREHQSRLAETLLAVLAHQGSVRLAAAELHIHQNTVRYRLETIRTELGIDLDHPPARLWIWLRLNGEPIPSG
jgi:sugar diacid utilization regulator